MEQQQQNLDWLMSEPTTSVINMFNKMGVTPVTTDKPFTEEIPIKIKYHNCPYRLEMNEKGGCVDLYNNNDIKLFAGESAFIKFGISMELPPKYDALIFPRSSTYKKYGILLTNSVGYIDNSYNGNDDEWMACIYATRDVKIPRGTRCFQFRLIERQPQLSFIEVDSLENENRGGYGSTGD